MKNEAQLRYSLLITHYSLIFALFRMTFRDGSEQARHSERSEESKTVEREA